MYTKIIRSGNLVEVYEYEKEPASQKPRRKSRFKNPRRYNRSVSRARASFIRLVQANLRSDAVPAFLTLTMREVVEIGEGWKAFSAFGARLRRVYNRRLTYIAVPEFQERGAVHFHALVWGLNHDEISSERSTRAVAKVWKHGFVDLRSTDGSPRLAGYLAKYMFKAMYDPRLSGRKAYSASRGLVRSVSLRSQEAINLIEAEISGSRIELDGSLSTGAFPPLLPEKEKQYMTKWLGKCNYKVYRF